MYSHDAKAIVRFEDSSLPGWKAGTLCSLHLFTNCAGNPNRDYLAYHHLTGTTCWIRKAAALPLIWLYHPALRQKLKRAWALRKGERGNTFLSCVDPVKHGRSPFLFESPGEAFYFCRQIPDRQSIYTLMTIDT